MRKIYIDLCVCLPAKVAWRDIKEELVLANAVDTIAVFTFPHCANITGIR